VAALQGVKRPVYGLIVGVMRQIALPLMVFPLFARLLNMGIAGIWWGIFVINWGAALITFLYSRAYLKRVLIPS
jgi:Na+-driven multidrug efflux pump